MRFALISVGLVTAAVLAGCPIYGGGQDDGDCLGCQPRYECYAPGDCPSGEVCGADYLCHVGQCDTWGCVSGYRCNVAAIDVYECVPVGNGTVGSTTGSGGAGGEGGEGGEGGGSTAPAFCAHPGDCGAGETCAPSGQCLPGGCDVNGCIFGYGCDETGPSPVCVSQNPSACLGDGECAGDTTATKCLSGFCTPPQFWCYDGSQCAPGDACADGKCTPRCDDGRACPVGFSCGPLGLCTEPTLPCAQTSDCGSGSLVCIAGACVPRAQNGSCPGSLVWVQNGCVHNQLPFAACLTEGTQDSCPAGSICVNHTCYVSCDAPSEQACDALPATNVCQSIATALGTYGVCGDGGGFGGDCDPTQGQFCAGGATCVDGFCL